jgi:hypothetical protein
MVPETGSTSATNVLKASALTHRVGFLNGRVVIPSTANGNFGRAGEANVGARPGLVLATSAETETASHRELVDPRGPLAQTRIHRFLSLARYVDIPRAHGAPDSFSTGY